MIKQTNWRIFFTLLSLCLLSLVCITPYVLTVQGDMIKSIGVPMETLFVAQFVQALVVFSFAIFFGLFFTHRIGFQLPLLQALTDKAKRRTINFNFLKYSVVSGILVALVIYGLDFFFTRFGAGITTHQNYAPVWQTLLAAVYGGVAEEVIMRLFLLSFFVWIGLRLARKSGPTIVSIVTSLIISSVIFGLGHLPITTAITAITPVVIARAIVLNGVGGLVFGYLFWKKGFESAVVAHFTADIFLLTVLPLLLAKVL